MRKIGWRPGDIVTIDVLNGRQKTVDGTFHEIDGRFLRLRLSIAIPYGSLVHIEKAGGDIVLGEVAHSQSEPKDMTIVEAEHLLFAHDLEAIRRCWTAYWSEASPGSTRYSRHVHRSANLPFTLACERLHAFSPQTHARSAQSPFRQVLEERKIRELLNVLLGRRLRRNCDLGHFLFARRNRNIVENGFVSEGQTRKDRYIRYPRRTEFAIANC